LEEVILFREPPVARDEQHASKVTQRIHPKGGHAGHNLFHPVILELLAPNHPVLTLQIPALEQAKVAGHIATDNPSQQHLGTKVSLAAILSRINASTVL
jgi:hypothetical protein